MAAKKGDDDRDALDTRLRKILDESLKGAPRRPRSRNKFERVAIALGDVADDFTGSDRDAISRVISILEERAEGTGR